MSNKNFVAYGDAETVLTEFASDIKEKESIFRFSTMPTASSTNVGQIIQYTGETTQDYTNGYFYKCVAKGTDPETYAWEAQPVQEGGGSGSDKEDKFRYSTMPEASATYIDKVVQYIGQTNSNYTQGYSYKGGYETKECIGDVSDYEGTGDSRNYTISANKLNMQTIQLGDTYIKYLVPIMNVGVLKITKERIFGTSVNDMRTELGSTVGGKDLYVSSSWNSMIIGDTVVEEIDLTQYNVSEIYLSFHLSVGSGNNTGFEISSIEAPKYAWHEIPVQSFSSDTIQKIEVEVNPTTFKPTNVYIMYEDGFEIKPFATATDIEIDETLKRYYAGALSLSDIQQVWSIGDTRDMYVDTIPYKQPLMPGQMGDVTLQMMIVDFNKNTLETPTSERTKALLCLHSKYNFGNIGMDDRAAISSGYGWENLKLRAWLNDNFKDAMPSAMVSRIKSVQRTFGNTTLYDEIYVLSREEAYGGYSYYDSDVKRIKIGSGGGTVAWWLCNESGNPSAGTGLVYPQFVNPQGQQQWAGGYTGRNGCIPAFCI